MTKKVYIFDTTLRDGEQTPGVSLNISEKLEIAKQLKILGVDVIEAGFPFASKGDFNSVKSIAQNVRGPVIVALARATKEDIEAAWKAVKYAENPRIHVFIATSDIHMKNNLKMKPKAVLETAYNMVKYAKELCASVEFSPEDATRTRPDFLYEVLEAVIDAGADVVNIPDTVGYSTPGEFGEFIKRIKQNVPNIEKAILSVHCHNDLGLAVANSLAAIENGAQQVECSINGLGERAGNAALEEIVMTIKTRGDRFKCHTDIATEHIARTSNMVSHLTGVKVQSNKAIVGTNAFAQESSIHKEEVKNYKETYEIMTSESIGLKKDSIILSKYSDRHDFEQRLKELGYDDMEMSKINEAYGKFKALADKKNAISDEDIEALVNEEMFQVPQTFKLEYLQVTSGNSIISTSTVKIRTKKNTIDEAACGDGPVDATFKAIEKATGISVNLKDYFLDAIGSGKDALGEVTVKIEKDNRVFSAKGISTDVVEASAKAFMNAINKMYYYINLIDN